MARKRGPQRLFNTRGVHPTALRARSDEVMMNTEYRYTRGPSDPSPYLVVGYKLVSTWNRRRHMVHEGGKRW